MAERALDLARKAEGLFRERGFDNARLEAELLLSGVLGMKRLDLYLQYDRPVAPDELERFRHAVRRRLKHEPLQYVLGTAAFRKLELRVDARVLVPRPETEVLVDVVLAWSAERRRQGQQAGAAVDIGTGSGAIALSLATEGSFQRVVATDVSADALDVARSNAASCGVTGGLEFRQGSLFAALRPGERFEAIVSNPPYVAESERDALAPEVRDHEPGLALFAGAGGLDVLAELVTGAPLYMETGGLLALEIGAGQADAVLALLRDAGTYRSARILPDLAGRPRIATAERFAD